MPLLPDFPYLGESLPKRKPPPDFTSRGTKLRLFGALAAMMLVLSILERGCDPRMRLGLVPVAEQRNKGQAAPVERPRIAPRLAAPDRGEMLDRLGIGAASYSEIADGEPLTGSEQELVMKTLYHLPRLGLENVERWRQSRSDWEELASNPTAHRAEVYEIRGRVRSVEEMAVPEAQAPLYEMGHYYKVSLALPDSEQAVVILARSVPKAWPRDRPLDEAAEADGFFVKTGAGDPNDRSLIFVADRVRWLPAALNAELGIGPSQLALANLGMDVGLWDRVREVNRLPLEAGDREAFYQLLAALGRREAADLKASQRGRLELGPLLQQPKKQQGELFAVEGVARRITRIDVPDADVQTRLGIDHYYEIDLFLPLGNAKIRLGDGPDQGPAFDNTFPATLIVRQLPPGLTADNNLHEQIRADAVFFKIWTYESRYAGKFGQVQPAPLFVACSPAIASPGAGSNWLVNAVIGSVLCTALAALACLAWFTRPQKRRQPDGPPPDFSGLR